MYKLLQLQHAFWGPSFNVSWNIVLFIWWKHVSDFLKHNFETYRLLKQQIMILLSGKMKWNMFQIHLKEMRPRSRYCLWQDTPSLLVHCCIDTHLLLITSDIISHLFEQWIIFKNLVYSFLLFFNIWTLTVYCFRLKNVLYIFWDFRVSNHCWAF